jgi:hypothetical protein
MKAYFDFSIMKWVASYQGFEAVDASLCKAVAIVFMMVTE